MSNMHAPQLFPFFCKISKLWRSYLLFDLISSNGKGYYSNIKQASSIKLYIHITFDRPPDEQSLNIINIDHDTRKNTGKRIL